MGNDAANHSTTHTSTPIDENARSEPVNTLNNTKTEVSVTLAQGEPLSQPVASKSALTETSLAPSHHEHNHRPNVPSLAPQSPKEQIIPGHSPPACCVTTRQQAAANSAPYEHEMLDPKTGKARALWLEAIDLLHKQTNASIRDPEDIIPIDTSCSGAGCNTSKLPSHVANCFKTMHINRNNNLPCFHAWVAQNYLALSQPRDTNDTDSPKWSDALKSSRKEEWMAAVGEEFIVLICQNVYEEILQSEVPSEAQLLSLGIVLKIKRDADGKEVCLKGRVVIHGNQQIAGVSYNKTFSNTPNLVFIRAVFLIIAYANLDCHMVNVTGTYTHAPINQPLYVEFPDGFGKNGPTIMKLKKALYGAHQSGRLWEHY
ncbi:hypothetical protein RSOLAG1IB_09992 [Rhizoctonia solani AG-1 IB]|uniref:Reverse transcriptase Ty1/copia-type domain-containing protein n=1 Tax=Thanatephorus cucumeris (strain AG1-IB / isolate 7/3/14) TaxID=1108050 RepID=A0A0B7FUK8_THACB|nr:hypothetical protein RSOLAG1IB_09992 [Rhizoctonia solani AG-1 IB]